jgi:hypothetical protein
MLLAMAIFVRLDPELEKEFRKVIIDKFDGQKGALEKGVEEAIRAYVKNARAASLSQHNHLLGVR